MTVADFVMPSLGADMEFGTLVEWRVKLGDVVKRGDVIAEVETQKGVIAVEVFHGGVVQELLVTEGTRVPVGEVLARLGDGVAPASPVVAVSAPAAPPSGAVSPPPAVQPVAPRPPAPSPTVVPLGTTPGRGRRASPAARRAAMERGIDIESIAGTGPEGAITIADVERAAISAPITEGAAISAPTTEGAAIPAPPAGERVPRISPVAQRMIEATGLDLARIAGSGADGSITRADVERALSERGAPSPPPPAAAPVPPASERASLAMRHAIAAAVSRSKREIPHYYLATDVDLGTTMTWLSGENAKRPVRDRLLLPAVLIRAVARALAEYPEFNGFWTDGAFHAGPGIHVGVAISLRGGGLVAPAIHDADRKTADELTRELRDLVQRARVGGLRSSEVIDPTITVTNLGDLGVDTALGIIYPPQVALIGFGRVRERPWAEAGMLDVRPVVTLTLAADHRSSDGHRGGLFLAAIARHLQTPEVQ